MASAKITMPDGVCVEVDGTPEEVTTIIERMKRKQTGGSPAGPVAGKNKGEIPQLVNSLKEEEFFKTPRGLGDIQKKLAELGHHYPVTTLSGAMQDQTRRRNLRRFKQEGKYVYVQ